MQLLRRVLKVARSTYYTNLNTKPSPRAVENQKLKTKILSIHQQSKGRYGSGKITQVLRQNGYPKISFNRVQRLMKQLNIRAITVGTFKNYKSKQVDTSLENVVCQSFTAPKPNQIWLTDIIYIHTVHHGWTYLASVLDVCTRKIVGYSYGRRMDKSLVISALERAVRNQNYPKDVVIHSDRGSQYACAQYQELLHRLGFTPSFSKKGCPFDNAHNRLGHL